MISIPNIIADFNAVSLSAVTWPNIPFSYPIKPVLSIGNPEIGPPEEYCIAQRYPGVDIPVPVFTYIDTSDMPPSTTITIPTPPTIEIQDITLEVPNINVTIPEGNVDWAYEQYINAIIDSAALQCGNLNNLHDNLWSAYMRQQNNIWTADSFNLVEVMGYVDELISYKNKELAYLKTLYQDSQAILAEAIRTRNLKIYISTMLNIQRQKRGQYADRKDLELLWAKDMVANSIKHYNLAVRVYAARNNCYKVFSSKFRAILEQNDLRLKQYDQLINIEELKMNINKNIIRRYVLETQVQEALIKLYKEQMEVIRKMSQIEAINTDIYRLGTQVFMYQIKEISEQAQQAIIVADVEVMKAELGQIDALMNDLVARYEIIQNDLDIARQKYLNAGNILNIRVQNLNAFNANLLARGDAEESLINNEAETHMARFETQEAVDQSKIDMSDERVTQTDLDVEAQEDIADKRAETIVTKADASILVDDEGVNQARLEAVLKEFITDLEVLLINARAAKILNPYLAEIMMLSLEVIARAEAAEILKDANLVNIFKEHEGAPA